MTGRLFCFGMGFTALRLAERLLAEGWTVAGTCRGAAKQAELVRRGIAAFRFDRDQPLEDAAAALAGTTHLLSSVPPDGAAGPATASTTGDPALDAHEVDITRVVTAAPRLRWVGYLSTTGVYGDSGGAAVDENTEPHPTVERSRRRVIAERAWFELGRRAGVPVQVFRLAGIYGPGRSALDQVREGRARRIDKPGQVFSRIHVDDIATILIASMTRPNPGAVYNCADDDPAPSHEVVAAACDLLGAPVPPLVPFDQAEATLSPMARSFYADNRRVANRRIKQELGVTLAYPSYRNGLAAILAAERRG